MRRVLSTIPAIALLSAATAFAQAPAAKPTASKSVAQGSKKQPLVEFEMMTWPEVKQALADGKTTALFYTGGTEQRGPQNVNGGHTLMGREIVRTIALRLGNAIAMPVLPYTPNNASADLPGTIGLTPELLGMILGAPAARIIGPVRGPQGWLFARLDQVSVAADTSFTDQVRGSLTTEILQARQRKFFDNYVEKLRSKAEVADLRGSGGNN